MNRLTTRTKLLLAAAALGLLAVACSSAYAATSGSDGDPVPGNSDIAETAKAIRADLVALESAAQPLVQQCMERQGLAYEIGNAKNGTTGSDVEQAAYAAALFGNETDSFTGLFGVRGTVPSNGCLAEARTAVAGSLRASTDIATAANDASGIGWYVSQQAKARGVPFDEAAKADDVQAMLAGVISRWQSARSQGVASLVEG